MNNIDYQDYEIYHDESKCDGYWHGILLVPVARKAILLRYLQKARENTNFESKIRFSDIKQYGSKYLLASSWLSIGACFLRSISKSISFPINLGKKFQSSTLIEQAADDCLGVKFILFRDKDEFANMIHYKDPASKIETSFRICLKGGLHYLFSENNAINIVKLHFDGYEHNRRHVNRERIVGRIVGLRSYCSFSDDYEIDDRSSDYRKPNSQSYEDCELLQLTDLIIGAFRFALGFHNNKENRFQLNLSKIFLPFIERYSKGYARMRNSRWFSSFCISQSYIEGDCWQFETIEKMRKINSKQLHLFNTSP